MAGTLEALKNSSLGPIAGLFYDVPELHGMLQKAADAYDAGDIWGPDKFLMEVRSTAWWQKTSQTQQEWKTLSQGEKNTRITRTYQQIVSEIQQQFGPDYDFNDKDWFNHATRIARGEYPIEVAFQRIYAGAIKKEGTPAWQQLAADRRAKQRPEEIFEELRERARDDYLVFGVNDKTYRKWAGDINGGKASEHDFNEFLRRESVRAMPDIKESIERGMLPRDFINPILETVGEELEMSSDQIVADKRFFGQLARQPISKWTSNDWIQYARSLPQWETTFGAQKMASDLASTILEKFGKTG